MIFRSLTTAAVLLLASGSAIGAPEDYADHIPHNIRDMELKDHSMLGGEFVAYYGETIGRATLRIFPAPEADAGGASDADPVTSGETPKAQRAMLDLLSRNLAEGTGALGEGFTTNAVRLFNVRLDGSDAIDGVSLACGFIERIQSEEAAPDGEEQMVLSDRVCLTQHNEDILAVSITTPHRPNSMRQDFNQAQISFSGMLIGTILRSAEDATSDDDE